MTTRHEEHPEWTAQLSAYLADELGTSEKNALQAHLASCGACARTLADLKDIVAGAGTLEDVEPPTDLWAGIAARLEVAPPEAVAEVLPFPRGRRPRFAPPPRAVWSTRRLAAAAVVLVALTSSLGWWAGSARAGAAAVGSAQGVEPADVVVVTTSGVAEPPADLAAELDALEEILASARGVLDPNTVLVIERSLGVIERAIADSRDALAQDPSNSFLAAHLERMYRRKLLYLQDAVRFAELGA